MVSSAVKGFLGVQVGIQVGMIFRPVNHLKRIQFSVWPDRDMYCRNLPCRRIHRTIATWLKQGRWIGWASFCLSSLTHSPRKRPRSPLPSTMLTTTSSFLSPTPRCGYSFHPADAPPRHRYRSMCRLLLFLQKQLLTEG